MQLLYQLAATEPTDHVTDKILSGGITMHSITVVVVGALFVWAMFAAARAIATGPESQGNDRYTTKGRWAQFVEVVVTYLRDEMLIPVLGAKHTQRYLPFLMTVFFFILFINVFGLIPLLDIQHLIGIHNTYIGGTATASITVTGALAMVSFVVIQAHGFRELGIKGYLSHLCGGLVPGPVYLLPVVAIVFVVEVAGQFIKPAALAIRLFANMVAGHTLMAVLLGFGGTALTAAGGQFTLGVGGITLVSALGALAISFLELFVAFLQAFIFMFLTAVFISLMSHHDEEHDLIHESTLSAVVEPTAP
jgi:F-type H+-transporting ATPase subunit a